MLIKLARNYPVLYDKRHPIRKGSMLQDLSYKTRNQLRLAGPNHYFNGRQVRGYHVVNIALALRMLGVGGRGRTPCHEDNCAPCVPGRDDVRSPSS
ncbi:hypothetical protein MRX96_046134 [Rhipicephalus microplus]